MENNLVFIVEQDGEIEREFKDALAKLFLGYKSEMRAYLVLTTTTANPNENSVMLCLRVENGEDMDLLEQCSAEFKLLFANNQYLDIMFLTDEHESLLRKICCPFFTSDEFQVTTPDFYLYSTEGYDLDDTIRNCYMRKRLYTEKLDSYLLCDISPPLIGQRYGLGDKDIAQIIAAVHYKGSSLFPISEWPIYIYVMRSLIENINNINRVTPADYELIGLAEFYQHPPYDSPHYIENHGKFRF